MRERGRLRNSQHISGLVHAGIVEVYDDVLQVVAFHERVQRFGGWHRAAQDGIQFNGALAYV